MRFVLGIDIGGTNLVVGSVAEDGSALHALGSEPTGAEAGERDVLDRLIALIRNSSDESPIVEFLHERERESMCFPSLGTARLKPVARKLLRLDDKFATGRD